MPITGQETVARNLIKWGGGFVKQVNKTMAGVAIILDNKITENMSLSDHSLPQLAKMGHPYSARRPQELHSPNFQVHRQSGNLLDSKQAGSGGASIEDGVLKATAFVMLDVGQAEYAPYVVYGTSKMIPRPVLGGSRDQVKSEVFDYMKSELKNLKVTTL